MTDAHKKKLLLLGGLRYLLPVIKAAHELGVYVITCDYIPDNIAHRYSDEYHNISILDREAVLRLAEGLNIDGIMSFAVDPGVTTAAFVAERLKLPFQGSLESVEILQDKSKFRSFLAANSFNVPVAGSYSSVEEAISDSGKFNWPVIVKPVDSAGSKGVTRIESVDQLADAAKYALSESHCKRFIIEDFLQSDGPSSDSECFVLDGKLIFCSFSDQLFDPVADNPYTPSAYIWPSSMPENARTELREELQRLIALLDLRTGIFNVETRLCTNGKSYIMEMSPRGGGNRLAEMLELSTGQEIIKNSVNAALGLEVRGISDPVYSETISEIILHSPCSGAFDRMAVMNPHGGEILEEDLWIKKGDAINGFTGANQAIGTLVLRHLCNRDAVEALDSMSSWLKIIVDKN